MSVRRRSQTQTHRALTSCPRTRSSRAKRYSNMMMLKTGSLFLILYGLCQIPLAQGQNPRKDETMETTQTWKSQESGAGMVSSAIHNFIKEPREINGVPINHFLLGDPAYPLMDWLMKGYIHSPNITPQESFNVYLSSARTTVEISFGD
ncbi:unnamed protein product [Gadus morhua 'NCC']